MRTMIVFSLLSALSLPVLAQSSDVSSVTIKPHSIKPEVQQHYRMSPDEFGQFVATYDLSNGMSITLFNRGFNLYAKLSNESPERIVAMSGNSFVSKESLLKIRIDLKDDGEVGGEVQIPISSSTVADAKTPQFLVVALR